MSIFYCRSKRERWLLLLLVLLSLQSKAFTQDSSRITVQGNNIPIETALRQIEKQSGFSFVYGKPTLDDTERITVDISGKGFTAVMDALLGARGIVWRFRGGAVVLSRRGEGALDTIPNVRVIGLISDQTGKPILGATIAIKGSSILAVSDSDGRFKLDNIIPNCILFVSCIGYETREIKIKGNSVLKIELHEKITELQNVEVVSTGYQTIPKERATGSFVQIDNQTITRGVSTNLLDRLLFVTNSLRAETAGGTNVSIRGLSTINANMVPLVVIDGFPYDEGIGKGASAIALANINPNDIESVTILRDAAAASIWGARSGNGVIVITTKKGTFNRKPTVQFNGSINFTEKPNLYALKLISSRDAVEYERKLFKTGFYDSYNGPFFSNYSYPVVSPVIEILLAQKRNSITEKQAEKQIEALAQHDVRDDISKYLLQTSVNQQYNINISGGGEKNSYYGSIGYDDNKSFIKRNNYSRVTFRIENTFKPNQNLEANVYINHTQSISTDNGIDYSRYVADGGKQAAPYTFLADVAGNPLHTPIAGTYRTAYIDTLKVPGLLDWYYKPLDELRANDNVSKQYNSRLGGGVRYAIIPGISLELKGQYEKSVGDISLYYSTSTYFVRDLVNQFMFIDPSGRSQYPVPLGGILDKTNIMQESWNIRAQLTLNRSWGVHSINAIAGSEAKEFTYRSDKGRKYGYDPLTLAYNSSMDYKNSFVRRPAGAGRIVDGNGVFETLNRFRSYFGNIGYNLRDKYTFTVSARMDGSNFFGVNSNQRNIPLWSSGVLWDISSEEFYKVKAIPYLKARITYGYNGNLNNSATALPIIRYSPGFSIYNNSNYSSLIGPPNPGLTWEKVRMINWGIDFGILDNRRITGSIEYYNKKGVDLIGSIESEPTTGFSSYNANYAEMKGDGVDILVRGLILNNRVKWNSSLSFSFNRDEITKYYVNDATLSRATNYFVSGLPVVGKPRYKLYSYQWAGLDPSTGNPRGYLADTIAPFNLVIQGNNTLPDDLIYSGNSMPRYFGNFVNSVAFKGVTLTFNIVYKFDYYFRRNSINYVGLQSYWGGHSDYSLRWRNPGDEGVTTVPSLPDVPDTRYSFYSLSEPLVEKGDHIRLQDIRMSYDLPQRILPFSSAQVYVYASNIGLIWRANKQNIDPDFQNTVAQKSVALGVNLRF